MPALPVLSVGSPGDVELVSVDGHNLERGLAEQQVQLPAARVPEARLDDDRCFQNGCRRDQSKRIGVDGLLDLGRLGFVQEDGEQSGSVDHHQRGSPCSS